MFIVAAASLATAACTSSDDDTLPAPLVNEDEVDHLQGFKLTHGGGMPVPCMPQNTFPRAVAYDVDLVAGSIDAQIDPACGESLVERTVPLSAGTRAEIIELLTALRRVNPRACVADYGEGTLTLKRRDGTETQYLSELSGSLCQRVLAGEVIEAVSDFGALESRLYQLVTPTDGGV